MERAINVVALVTPDGRTKLFRDTEDAQEITAYIDKWNCSQTVDELRRLRDGGALMVVAKLRMLPDALQAATGLQQQLDAAIRERDAARAQLAEIFDHATQASASDGGWLAKLVQRWGRG